jgi:chromosome partitioning protein
LSHLNGSEVLTANKHAFEPFDEDKKILLVEANDALMKVDKRGESHNAFAGNFNHYLSTQAEYYDLCIIDTNPNPDIRMLSALVSTDYVLSPIQLNQEAIDGIGELLNNPTVGLNKIRKAINPNLTFLGLLPNLVEPTPFQKNNLKILSENFGKLLFKHEKGGFCAVKRSTAIPEAQALGSPLWLIPKTSARDSSKNLNRIFDTLLSVMELDNDND